MRKTCLYCEQDGKTTALVQVGHWGCCPIHSADYIAQNRPPTVESVLAQRGIVLDLKNKGIRDGVY